MLEEIESECAAALAALEALDMNTLFARAVLQHEAPGHVFVDDRAAPKAIYVVHDYGMSLLFGADVGHDRLAAQVIGMHRTRAEWLQVSPSDPWTRALERVAPAIERFTRVNFRFSPSAYRERRPRLAACSHDVARADLRAFAMPGSVVPPKFWTDARHFLEAGAGYGVHVDGELAALAFSSFVTSSMLEIGIETLPAHRGRGLATSACVALIDHCLARGLEPVWACRLENTASHRLAERLGFVPVRHLPYFHLPAALP